MRESLTLKVCTLAYAEWSSMKESHHEYQGVEQQTEETCQHHRAINIRPIKSVAKTPCRCDCWVCGCILQKEEYWNKRKDEYTKTTARIMNFIAELELAGHKVDMMIIQRRAGKHSPMRVESRARDRRRPVVA